MTNKKKKASEVWDKVMDAWVGAVKDDNRAHNWQDEFYHNMNKHYPYAEHIPEIKDSVEEFQRILDNQIPLHGYSLDQVGKAYDAGFNRGYDQQNVLKPDGNIYPDKEQFIKSLKQ